MSQQPDSPENPHAGQGSVLLDIGGDIGALIVTMPLETVGSEVEILRHGTSRHDVDHGGHDDDHTHDHGHGHGHGHGHPPHVAVVRRPVETGATVPSLVFADLERGRYDLVEKGSDEVRLTVRVSGGEVTTAVWPG